MTVNQWNWIGTFGMAIGAAILFFMWSRRTKAEEEHSALHFFVPLVAMASYLAMALHQGQTVLRDGTTLYYARFIDWSITTPLLLFGLSLTALRRNLRRPGIVGALIASDLYMIITGLIAGYSEGYAKWIWFTVSCVAFLGVYGAMWGPLKREAQMLGDEINQNYSGSAAFLSVIWFLYPIVFLIGETGIKMIDPVSTAACFTLLDLTAKVVYGIWTTAKSKALTSHEVSGHMLSDEELILAGSAPAMRY